MKLSYAINFWYVIVLAVSKESDQGVIYVVNAPKLRTNLVGDPRPQRGVTPPDLTSSASVSGNNKGTNR